MRVRLKCNYASPTVTAYDGQIARLPEAAALQLIEQLMAEPAPEEEKVATTAEQDAEAKLGKVTLTEQGESIKVDAPAQEGPLAQPRPDLTEEGQSEKSDKPKGKAK